MNELSGFLQHMLQSAAASASGANQPNRGTGVGGFLNSDFGRGGLAGGALGLLLGGNKKTNKLAKYGGVAALGMMVFEAYSQYQKQQAGATGAAAQSGGADFGSALAGTLLKGAMGGGGATGGAGGLLGAALGALGGGMGAAATQTGGSSVQSALLQSFMASLSPAGPQTIDKVSDAQAAEHSVAILQALIAAAKADGHIDERETAAIEAEFAQAGLDAASQQWLREQVQKPLDAAEVARAARTPEMAGEMYLASLMVIDEQNPAERAYLQALGTALGLPEAVQQHLQQQLLQRQS